MTDNRNSESPASADKPWRFQPGNPGRKPGVRNRATVAAMALLEGEAEALTRKAVEMALAGDPVALKLMLDRILPKSRAVRIDLPMGTLAELEQATATVREALAAGEVSLDEVATIAGLVEARRRVIETRELERRLAALEEGQGR